MLLSLNFGKDKIMKPIHIRETSLPKYPCEKCEKKFPEGDLQKIFLDGRSLRICKPCRYKLIPKGQYE